MRASVRVCIDVSAIVCLRPPGEATLFFMHTFRTFFGCSLNPHTRIIAVDSKRRNCSVLCLFLFKHVCRRWFYIASYPVSLVFGGTMQCCCCVVEMFDVAVVRLKYFQAYARIAFVSCHVNFLLSLRWVYWFFLWC